MTWSESISAAIRYIEDHLAEPLSVEEIARAATLSPFYFQRGFAMLCGMSVGEYIRKRRLSQAGLAVLASDRPIIDIALDFGYDSPDGFTKAFTRFHGVTPTALRKSGGTVVSVVAVRVSRSRVCAGVWAGATVILSTDILLCKKRHPISEQMLSNRHRTVMPLFLFMRKFPLRFQHSTLLYRLSPFCQMFCMRSFIQLRFLPLFSGNVLGKPENINFFWFSPENY